MGRTGRIGYFSERRLAERLGQPYIEYTARVKRWIPGLF